MKLYKIKPSELAVQVIKACTAVEAGWVNHGDDLGKETSHGITYATSREHELLWPLYHWDGNMKKLPIELAYHIYYISWWRKMKLDRIAIYSPELARLMFDFGVNAGRRNCIRELQKILTIHNRKGELYADLEPDGYIGGKTLTAVEDYLQQDYRYQKEKLLFHMHCARDYHYISISMSREKNESFTNGWSDRAFNMAKDDSKVMFGN